MNNKLLFLLIIMFLIIFILSIFIFVINNKNQVIEKFETTPMNYPRIKSNTTDTISINILYNTNTNINGINLSEKYDIIADSAATNLGINGYGTYYINSTFYINNPSVTNCISSLFNNNNNKITLNSPKQNSNENMISIIYPERFQFKGIEMTIDGDAKNILENNIILYASFNNTPSRINTTAIFNGNKINLNIATQSNVIFDNTLYIVFRKNIDILKLTNITIFGMPLNYVEKQPNVNTFEIDNTDIKIFTDNKYELLSYPDTNINYNTDNNINNIYPEKTIIEKFNTLLRNNRPPWAMYNAKYANNGVIPDLFNRECRKATISGQFDIINEKIGINNNITYLKGYTNTIINFPLGSLPEKYTVCVMSKYANSSGNRSRILTTSMPRNWLLGHWGNRSNGIMYNDAWKYYDNINDAGGTSTDWLISCAKSSANKTSFSIIFNDVNKAFDYAGENNDNPSSTYLTINGSWTGERSDFCFGYLIIWDIVLSDSELLTVSQSLTNYVNTGQELDISNIKISNIDGKSPESAGDSAYAIKLATCTNDNGIYWIKTPNGPPKQVYCIMDSECYGGGWMLAMKGSNTSGIFSYYGTNHPYNGVKANQDYNTINHWETNSVVRENDLDYNSGDDAKYDIFNYFKVSECLAIFDKRDTGNNTNNKYGWTWYEPKFYNNKLSLKDFFATSRAQFTYYSSGDYDFVAGYNANKPIEKQYDPAYITRIRSNDKKSFEEYIINKFYSNKIWSRQEEFKAFGFNIIPFAWEHKVRWGGTFNENGGGIPDSNDVSGGIGLSTYKWNAGNSPTCCESAPGVQARQMGFKWFIR